LAGATGTALLTDTTTAALLTGITGEVCFTGPPSAVCFLTPPMALWAEAGRSKPLPAAIATVMTTSAAFFMTDLLARERRHIDWVILPPSSGAMQKPTTREQATQVEI
jgi:hypothetical protein